MHTLDTPYLRVAGGFGARLALVSDQQWHLPTPCTEWTVKELTNHVVNTHQRVYVMAVSSGIEGIDDAESIIDRWAVVSAALRRARFDPTLRRTPVTPLDRVLLNVSVPPIASAVPAFDTSLATVPTPARVPIFETAPPDRLAPKAESWMEPVLLND